MLPSIAAGVTLAALAATGANAQYANTYQASANGLPAKTETGQTGTNNCGTGSDPNSQCQNVYLNSEFESRVHSCWRTKCSMLTFYHFELPRFTLLQASMTGVCSDLPSKEPSLDTRATRYRTAQRAAVVHVSSQMARSLVLPLFTVANTFRSQVTETSLA